MDSEDTTAALLDRVAALEVELAAAKAALALREQRFRMIAENVREVLLLQDPRTRQILYVNPVFEELWQIPAQEFYDDPEAYLRAVVPEDRARLVDLLRVQQETAVPVRCEYRIQVGAGPLRWISARSFPVKDETGQVQFVVALAEDITPRKERELNQEARLRLMMESAFEGILTTDAAGLITYANARIDQILGYTRAEIMGRPSAAFQAPTDAAQFPERLARRAQGLSEDLDLTLLHKNGHPVEVRVAVSPLFEGGVFVGALSMVSNVTERNRIERQLRTSLEEKEVLLREVHHRVKNNLQVVSSLLSLQANTVQDGAARAALEESRERIQSIALAHELLYRSNDLARVDFRAYLRELTRVVARPFVRAGVTIELNLEGGPLELPLDVMVPCGLLINELLTNALRHAFPDGRTGRVTIGCNQGAAGHELSVSDDGIGISPDALAGRPRSLGLRLVHSLVRQLGAELDVLVENGSRFRVKFPLGATAPGPERGR